MLQQDNEIMPLFHFHEIHASTKVQVMNVCVIILHEGRRASIFGHGISRTCFYVVAPAKLCSKERNFETMQTHTKSNFIRARARARADAEEERRKKAARLAMRRMLAKRGEEKEENIGISGSILVTRFLSSDSERHASAIRVIKR